MTVAVRTTVELLRFRPELPNTTNLFASLVQAAKAEGIELVNTSTYRGGADLLMLWGPGGVGRIDGMRQQLAAGGHVVCFDAAYFSRASQFRVSIDAPHPQAWVMRRDWPSDRWRAVRLPVANAWDPAGPVIIAGIGRKAREQYGDMVTAWEAEIVTQCQARWPGRAIRYRRKPHDRGPFASQVQLSNAGPIEHVLNRTSLVISWHSNVAIDAIRLGIPVICRDGAAAAVCPSALGVCDPTPLDPAVRARFLANLAWFQWGTTHQEALGCWRFLQELLS